MGVVYSSNIKIIKIGDTEMSSNEKETALVKKNEYSYNNIGDNVDSVKEIVDINDYKYIGKKSTNVRVRIYECTDPQKTAFKVAEKLSMGHVSATPIKNGMVYIMKDGSAITYRSESSSADKSPVVDINSADETKIKTHKIHFVRRKEND